MEEVIKKAGLTADGWYVVATGVGGKAVTFSQQQKAITTCLARGVHLLFPDARMVIDLGAETSTILKVNDRGRVTDWAGQDKCAAGTGMFLQAMAKVMQVNLDEMAEYSLRAKNRADISGTCAVFAESEVISHIHRVPPTPKEDIIAGIHASMVSRMMGLLKRLGIEKGGGGGGRSRPQQGTDRHPGERTGIQSSGTGKSRNGSRPGRRYSGQRESGEGRKIVD